MLEGFTPFPSEFAERYRANGYWLDQPLGDYFRDRFVEQGDRLAIVAGEERISYAELNGRIEHLARHLLDLGIAPLERVILQLPNVPEFLYLYFALQRVGAAVSTGRIIFGAVGDETRLEYTVIGDAVNRSAKFEKHTKTEKVRALCDAVTYQTALAQSYPGDPDRETRTVRSIDGIDGPVDMVVLAP